MDLMTLAAKITLDDKEFRQGVSGAEKMGQQLAGKMSAMTVAVGNIAADMIKKGVSAINSVVSGAMDGYADYQQLIGGVETLFKSSASKVANYAKQSFKTTGLSANDYMSTVTSFSASLLQGLGGDTETAADLANTAITDMADNANKMGTDISSIQAAYQGFAKQNYTMLDNLKLGYGGTAKEMVRLINDSGILEDEIEDLDGITFDQLVKAIHEVQTNLGITGTTAKEAADTISGSKASLASAWQDLLVAVTSTDQSKTDWWNDPLNESVENFKTSFSTYIENIVPALVQTIGNSGTLVGAIADAIAELPTQLMSQVAEEGLNAGTKMIGGISEITSWLISSIADMFVSAKANQADIEKFGKAMGDFLGTAISDIVKYAPDILEGIITVGVNLASGLVEGLFQGLFGQGAEVDKITEQLQSDLTDIDLNNSKATGILSFMDKLYEKYGNGVTRVQEWKQAQKELEEYLPAAGKVFQNYGNDIQGALDTLDKLNESMRKSAIVSGLQKALHEQYELLGEQMGKQSRYETEAGIATEQQGAIRDMLYSSIKAYAGRALDLTKDNPMVTDAARAEYERIQKGFMTINDQEFALEDVDFDELTNLFRSLGELADEGEDSIWNLNPEDYIVDPETLEAAVGEYDKLQSQITEALRNAADMQEEVKATNEQIAITETAVKRAIENQRNNYTEAAEGIKTGGTAVQDALKSLASTIASFSVRNGITYMPEATGIDDVPFNGFRAELHKGEAVLTRSQADKYRAGGDTAALIGELQSMRNDLQNMRLVVGRKTFGRAVVDYGGDRLSGYIGRSDSRYSSGYGT